MFFRRVELSKARAKDARLPVIAARGDLLLLDAIFSNPHFRAVVVGSVADDDNLENGFIGREIELVVQLSDEWADLSRQCAENCGPSEQVSDRRESATPTRRIIRQYAWNPGPLHAGEWNSARRDDRWRQKRWRLSRREQSLGRQRGWRQFRPRGPARSMKWQLPSRRSAARKARTSASFSLTKLRMRSA